ncbi:hypothetical protein V8C43DRAFT_283366 [Trichoderma afarasin]
MAGSQPGFWFSLFQLLLFLWVSLLLFGCASRERGVVSKRPLSKALVCLLKTGKLPAQQTVSILSDPSDQPL